MRKQLGTAPATSLDATTKGYVDGAVVTVTAATYTANNRDYVLANCTSNSITITVPNGAGSKVTVKRIDATVNTLTVVPSSGTLDGDPNATMVGAEVSAMFVGDGTNVGVTAVNGSQYQNASITATANMLALRDASGRTQFATPAASADAATKGYVDGVLGGYQSWTPTLIQNGATLTNTISSASWCRINGLIHAQCQLNVTQAGSAGIIQVSCPVVPVAGQQPMAGSFWILAGVHYLGAPFPYGASPVNIIGISHGSASGMGGAGPNAALAVNNTVGYSAVYRG
jgi:hypothetical protein